MARAPARSRTRHSRARAVRYRVTMAHRDEDPSPEDPSPEDLERFGSEYRTCPNCSGEVSDQAELCPICGHHFSHRPGGPPVWAIAIAILVLLAFLLVVLPL